MLVRWIVARLLINRLFGGSGRRSRQRPAGWGGRSPAGWGGRRPARGRGRAGLFGPFPYYTRRTRRGSVTVGGCCLPLALGMLAVPAAAGRLIWRRVSR
jgi:hypothetical protein